MDTIEFGRMFDTPFETGCMALAAPDDDGNFLAHDSDGVVCEFHTAMVIATHDDRERDYGPVTAHSADSAWRIDPGA